MSIYRGAVCPVCNGSGKVSCDQCGGLGRIVCDICNGTGTRVIKQNGEMNSVPCLCETGHFTCTLCSGGTAVCGQCQGKGH
ncbi:MAG: hypothetical protein IPK82_11915 [Polyangiaceae bacterium]|nr:hypothetical protein [Polyangiaceae bacterium]